MELHQIMASLEEGAFVLLRKLSYHTKAVSFAGLLYKCNSILANRSLERHLCGEKTFS